ncbi:MAG: hypothetical protein ACD_15C00225G0029 [uncultured bacterium]|nr:MAG: hypothetical protein ACD_15C00225G0029 [uncultured bacterium]HCU71075.1 hypothetical protein [Candidatus Moranbacteria bacterium]
MKNSKAVLKDSRFMSKKASAIMALTGILLLAFFAQIPVTDNPVVTNGNVRLLFGFCDGALTMMGFIFALLPE